GFRAHPRRRGGRARKGRGGAALGLSEPSRTKRRPYPVGKWRLFVVGGAQTVTATSSRTRLVASTMLRSDSTVSSYARVFRPQSGFTHSWRSGRTSTARRSSASISPPLGQRGVRES